MLNKEKNMAENTKKVLFIIDPQNDFMDIPGNPGSLAVPGALADMKRLAESIAVDAPEAIVVSMDTHSTMDVAHHSWWVNAEGAHPGPFEIIKLDDVKSGKWRTARSEEQENALYYLEELEKGGKQSLCIWPDHCIKGTWGHDVVDVLAEALENWERKTGSKVEYVYKGENPNTEHYSALKAEVVWNDNGYSELRTDLIDNLSKYDVIAVAGEAKSHCVANTVYDLMSYLNKKNLTTKVEIINDCMSSVVGFEALGDKFENWVTEQGNMSIVETVKKSRKLGM